MEIDLDNLVFNGLEEAQERTRNVWKMQTRKRRRLLPTMIAAMPARSDSQGRVAASPYPAFLTSTP